MLHYVKKTPVILLAAFLLLTLSAFQAQTAPTVTAGGLLQYSSKSEFNTAFPGFPVEDFEESPVASGVNVVFDEPLDATSNIPGAFQPGDILSGLTIQTVQGTHPPENLFVGGPGFGNNASKAVGSNYSDDDLDILFSSNNIYAVGLDIIFYSGSGDTTVTIYGTGGIQLEQITVPIALTETFLGLYSSQPITRITIESATFYEIIDNIQFGGSASTLTFYTSQATFEAAHPGLPVEDFEESPVASGALVPFAEPLNSTTTAAGAFSPGDILEGLQIQTITPSSATPLSVIGDNYAGLMTNASKMVCSSATADDLKLTFPSFNAYAIGMDLLPASLGGPDETVYIAVYGVLGNLLGTTALSASLSQETFLGMSSNQLISTITATTTTPPRSECVDNIQFGGSPMGLTFFNTEADFRKVRSTLPKEDFSESTVADSIMQLCDEPINSTTNQANCFQPGDILSGISFQTVDSLGAGCPTCMGIYGRNYGVVANTNPLLTAAPPDTLEIAFSANNIYYVGIDVYTPSLFSIYDTNNNLLGNVVRIPTSYGDLQGIRSTKPIGRIQTDNPGVVIGAVQFGSKFPWPMFLPAINK